MEEDVEQEHQAADNKSLRCRTEDDWGSEHKAGRDWAEQEAKVN